jgi:hypothetical protein
MDIDAMCEVKIFYDNIKIIHFITFNQDWNTCRIWAHWRPNHVKWNDPSRLHTYVVIFSLKLPNEIIYYCLISGYLALSCYNPPSGKFWFSARIICQVFELTQAIYKLIETLHFLYLKCIIIQSYKSFNHINLYSNALIAIIYVVFAIDSNKNTGKEIN